MTDRQAGGDAGANDDDDGAARRRPDGGQPATVAGLAVSRERLPGTGRTVRRLATVAAREYRVVHRAGWTLGLAAVFAAFAAGVTAFGATGVGPTRPGAILLTLAELGTYLVPLAALALGYGTVAGAAERATLEPVLALPAPRWVVLVGTYAGRAVAFAGAAIVGFGAGGTVFVRLAGASAWPAYVAVVGASMGVGLAFLALGVLVSTVAREKARALGAALAAWAWFVLAHDLAALGVVAVASPPAAVLSALVLANPAGLLRVLAAAAVGTGAGGGGAAAAAPSVPVALAALGAWIAVPLAAATVALRRR